MTPTRHAAGLGFQLAARESLQLELSPARRKDIPAVESALVHLQRPGQCADVSVVEREGFGLCHAPDYGAAHMGAPIYFHYGRATLDCMETPGSRIRTLRKARKLTQAQLAEAMGIDQSTLSDIERGAGFTAETLMLVCDALEANPYVIMRGATSSSPAVKRAAEAVRRLTEDERATLWHSMSRPGLDDDEVEQRIPATKALKKRKPAT